MAKLRDISHVMSHVGPWTFLKRIYLQSQEDNLLSWAAALAYSWLFALFPFLIFCLSLVPLLPDQMFGRGIKPSEETIRTALNSVLITGVSLEAAAEDVVDETLDDPQEQTEVPLVLAPSQASEEAEAAEEPKEDVPETIASPESLEATSPVADTLASLVDKFLTQRPTSALALLSIGLAVFFASGGMAMTMAGLDKCYDVQFSKMRPVWKSRPIAMLLTIIVGLLILLTITLIPIGGAIINWAGSQKFGEVTFGWVSLSAVPLRWTLGVLLLLSALALVYKFGPSVKTRFHLLSPGAIFAVGMWILTAFGFRFYVDKLGAADNYARTYGAVAGVAIMMLLFYIDALFLLIGAEINAEIDLIKLGIKSGESVEEREIAPIPQYELDEEDRELKSELEDKRSVDESEASQDNKDAEPIVV